MRVVLDLFATFLMAAGATAEVLVVQLVWLPAMVLTMCWACARSASPGPAGATSPWPVFAVLPLYVDMSCARLGRRRHGASSAVVRCPCWPPSPAVVVCSVDRVASTPEPLACSSSSVCFAVLLTYALPLSRWWLRSVDQLRRPTEPASLEGELNHDDHRERLLDAPPMPVPLVDLRPQNDQVADEVRRGDRRGLESGAFILGPQVRAFEEEFAAFCGVDALRRRRQRHRRDRARAARRSASARGDEVIVPANTFIATAEAVVRAGADARARRLRPTRLPASTPTRWPRRGHAAHPRDHAGAPLRPDGADGGDPRGRRPATCSLSSRTPRSRRARRRHGRPRRHLRRRRGHQLLPRQEPRRLRRRRRGAHRRRRARRAGSALLRNHGGAAQVRAPRGRLQLPARHAAGGGAVGQAAPPRPTGTPSARAAAARYDELLADVAGVAPAAARCRATSTSGTSTSCGSPSATRCSPRCTPPASAPASTTRRRSTCTGASRTSGCGPGVPGGRASRGGDPVAADVPRHHRGQQERVATALSRTVAGTRRRDH